MQRNTPTFQELADIVIKSDTYKQAKNSYSAKFKCVLYTNQLFDEIKDRTQSVRISVNFGDHWFLIANTSDKGIVIIDPSFTQMIDIQSRHYPFFIGTREELWELIKEEQSLAFLDHHWPQTARVIYEDDLYNDEMKRIFELNIILVKVGNEIKKENVKIMTNRDSGTFFQSDSTETEKKPDNSPDSHTPGKK